MKINKKSILFICGLLVLGLYLMELIIQKSLLQRPERQTILGHLTNEPFLHDYFGDSFSVLPEDIGSDVSYKSDGSLSGNYMFLLSRKGGQVPLKVNWRLGTDGETIKIDVFEVSPDAKQRFLFSSEIQRRK